MYNHTRAYINVYEYIYTDIHIYIYIHIHMHIYTHTCTHIYIRIHMHTYAQIDNLSNNASTCQAISDRSPFTSGGNRTHVGTKEPSYDGSLIPLGYRSTY